MASQTISTSTGRLPMSLSSVVNDLEAEGVKQIATACLVTSRGVTRTQRGALLKSIFGLEEADSTAFGQIAGDESEDGLVVAHPTSKATAADVASTVVACGGTVVYVPSPIDLSRGEGLFDTLAPSIERLIATGKKSPLLVVVSSQAVDTQVRLEEAASSLLQNLVQPTKGKKAMSLTDVFSSIEYVSMEANIAEKLASMGTVEPQEAAATIADTIDFFAPTVALSLSNKDLAAARKLGPAARSALEYAIETVVGNTGSGKLVSAFGDLCDATVKRAMQDLGHGMTSSTAQKIKAQLQDELYAEMGDTFDQQIKLLQTASFEDFKKDLSQLRVSPMLSKEMEEVVEKAIAKFGKAAEKLKAKGATWSALPAKTSFAKQLKEFCAERLLAAKASGQYRSIPRKGVTVGFHWLLPKPFGNDFRQEPWMVHATDNMVYVPPDKLTNVSPQEIKDSDWRTKIVPNPISREMTFVQ